MNQPFQQQRDWPYLILVIGLATVPIVYFYNGLATEYYFSKSLWASLLIPAALVVALVQALRQGAITLPATRAGLPLLLFWVWCVLSLAWSTNPGKGIEVLTRVGIAPAAFLATTWLVRREAQVRGLLLTQLLASTIVCVYGFVQYFQVVYLPYDQYGDPDPSSTIGLTNFVVEYMILIVAAPLALGLREPRRWVRALYAIAWMTMLAYFLVSRNRNGFIALAVVAISTTLLLVWLTRAQAQRLGLRLRTVLLGIAIGILVATAVVQGTTVGQRVFDRITELFEVAPREDVEASWARRLATRLSRDASVRFRLQTWYQALDRMFPDAPWVGVGLGNLEIEFPRFYTEFLEGMTIRNNTRVVECHNEYLQYLIDLGLIGLILFLWMLVQAVRTAHSSLQRVRGPDDLALWLALHAGLPGFASMAFFAFPLHLPTSGIIFFAVLGLSAAQAQIWARRDGEVPEPSVLSLQEPSRRHVVEIALALVLLYAGVNAVVSYRAMVAEVRSKEARVYRHNKRYAEAERLLDAAIAYNPRHEGFFFDRAVSRQEQGKLAEVYEDLRRVAVLVPYYGMGREQIGMLAMQLGHVEEAVEHLRAAAKIYPSRRARIERVAAADLLQAGRPDLAADLLAESVATGMAEPYAVALFAEALVALGRPHEALAAIAAQEKAQEAPVLVAARALALAASGRAGEALGLWQTLTLAAPQQWAVWYGMARAAVAEGRPDLAVTALQRALALEPRLAAAVARDTTLLASAEVRAWVSAEVGTPNPDARMQGPWLVPAFRSLRGS